MTPSTPAADPFDKPADSALEGRGDEDGDCAEAVAEVYRFLDGELDVDAVVQIEAHLRRCSPCLEAFDFEAELRRVIVARCSEEMPSELRDRFCRMLRELAVTDGDGAGVPRASDPS